MRKIAVAVSSFLLTVAVYAGYVGVMTDEATGIVAPPVLEARIAKWAAITGKPTTVDGYGITDAATESWVAQYVSDNTTPMDMTNEPAFKGWTNVWHDLITNHLNITAGNPHGITPAMIGAATTGEMAQATAGIVTTDVLASAVAGLASSQQVIDLGTSISNGFVKTNHIGDIDINGNIKMGSNNAVMDYYGYAGRWAIVAGRDNKASWSSIVSGDRISNGVYSLSVGRDQSCGQYAMTIGDSCSAADYSVAIGSYARATNVNSFVWNGRAGFSDIGGSRGDSTFTAYAPGGIYLIGPLNITDTNFLSVLSITTSGVLSAKSFVKKSSTATNDVAVSVTLDSTTYYADSDGDIDLGSPIFTNAYDGISRELAFTAYKSATNADAVAATAYLTATNAYYWAGLAYEAGTSASIIGTNAYNLATTAYAIAVSSLASATGAFARTEILDAFIQTNVITKQGFTLTTGTNDTSWDAASQTLNIRLADIGNALVGATIEGGTVTTNAGVLAIVVDNPTNAAEAVLTAYTNALPLPGCAILSVDPATSNAWIGASGLYGFYTVTNNTTPWNLCISNTQYRSPYGYGIKVVSTQAITAATNMVRVGPAPAALTATNLIAVWPHEDPAMWNYKIQAQ